MIPQIQTRTRIQIQIPAEAIIKQMTVTVIQTLTPALARTQAQARTRTRTLVPLNPTRIRHEAVQGGEDADSLAQGAIVGVPVGSDVGMIELIPWF